MALLESKPAHGAVARQGSTREFTGVNPPAASANIPGAAAAQAGGEPGSVVRRARQARSAAMLDAKPVSTAGR
jgi:hypothetical protein